MIVVYSDTSQTAMVRITDTSLVSARYLRTRKTKGRRIAASHCRVKTDGWSLIEHCGSARRGERRSNKPQVYNSFCNISCGCMSYLRGPRVSGKHWEIGRASCRERV